MNSVTDDDRRRQESEIAWQLHTVGNMLGSDYKLTHKQLSDRTHIWQQYVIEYGRQKKSDDKTDPT